jgi:hypothetical protein
MLKLFIELLVGQFFHFYDTPERKLIKSDSSHYISPEGTRRLISPFVAVFTDNLIKKQKSIYDHTKGDSNGNTRS